MSKQISTAAGELLDLENSLKSGPLSDEQQTRWEELVIEIFNNETIPRARRRSFRLASNSRCVIKMNEKKYDADMMEVSLLGFSFESEKIKDSPVDFNVTLDSAEVLNKKVPINLQCKIINSKVVSGRLRYGVEISKINSLEALDFYYQNLYYPFYIKYLESLKG